MVKRDFSAWDFVKQEPKKQELFTIDGGTLITDYPNVIIGGGDWIVDTTAGQNNIVLGQNMSISSDVNDTVFVQNLSVAGTTDIPPQEGQMRYNVDSQMTEVYHQDEWMEIGYTHDVHQGPRLSRWEYLNPIYWFNRFVNFMENRA